MSDFIFQDHIQGISVEELRPKTNFTMPNRHLHDTVEILYMLDGERYFFIEQNIYYIKKGMAIMINHNQLHHSSMVDDSSSYHRLLVYVDTALFDKYFSFPTFPTLQEFGEKYWGIAEFSPEDWTQNLHLFEVLKKEITRKTSDGDTISALLVMQLMTLFVRNRKNFDFTPPSISNAHRKNLPTTHQTVYEIALYLQNHSHENCSLDDIAAQFYISRSYLTRIFKSVTGFTISEYLMTCRVQKAKILLRKTDLEITEIALRAGFGNVSYFDKIFKRMTDYTPLQYRKRNK